VELVNGKLKIENDGQFLPDGKNIFKSVAILF